jgi:alpha-beta hydrolase superfamily lysophospholipase
MSQASPETGTLDGKLGIALNYEWHRVENASATLVFIHGLAEHTGRYRHIVAEFTGRGYSCFVMDLRGHGRSGGKRVFVNRFSEYVEDTDRAVQWVKNAQPDVPVFVVGHSMGGLIAATYALTHADRIAGVVLSSPAFGAAVPIPAWKNLLGKVASRVHPALAVPTGISSRWISRDPAVVTAYDNDPLVTKKATARWYTEFLDAQEQLFAQAQRFKIPYLMLVASADKIVDPAAMQRFHGMSGSEDKAMEVYPELYHEVFNEPEKDAVFADVANWLASHQ